ncbi:MAG: MarR family transcriptional regulator [Spirochaetales bacterium]|nr:MarR family transcriptional regulator [Spirochaetales bacterium]
MVNESDGLVGLEPDLNLELERIIDLMRSSELIFFRNFEAQFKLPPGLNFTHVKASMILRFNRQCTMSELSALMLLEKGSFTPVATRLMEKGYIEKIQSVEDKRVYNLRLTEAGMDFTRQFGVIHRAYVRKTIEKLTSTEQVEYMDLVEKLNVLNRRLLGIDIKPPGND